MDLPLSFTIGPLHFLHSHIHLFFEILAIFVGFRCFLYLRKRSHDSIRESDRVWIFAATAIGALIGARFLGVLESPYHIAEHYRNPAFWFHTKTILGALLGGLIATELMKKKLKVTYSSGDLITYPLIFGIMIGRLGCFLSGIKDGTHGIATNLPWGMDLGDQIKRHPTALYEIFFLAALWIFLLLLEKNLTLRDGARFKIFLSLYFCYRFFAEFLKPRDVLFFELSTLQIACIMGMLYYFRVFISPRSLILEKN